MVYLLKHRWNQYKFSGVSNILIDCQACCKAEPANDAKPRRNGHIFREVGMQGTQMSLSGFSSAWWRDCPQKYASAKSRNLENMNIKHSPGLKSKLTVHNFPGICRL